MEDSIDIEKWLFDHAQIQGHRCDGIKGIVDSDEINIGFRDTVTGECVYITNQPTKTA